VDVCAPVEADAAQADGFAAAVALRTAARSAIAGFVDDQALSR
jgi:hypothetical protein